MSTMSNEMRELTADELDVVSGGTDGNVTKAVAAALIKANEEYAMAPNFRQELKVILNGGP